MTQQNVKTRFKISPLWTWFLSIWIIGMFASGLNPYNPKLSKGLGDANFVNFGFFVVTLGVRTAKKIESGDSVL